MDERMSKAMAALELQRQKHGLNLSGKLYSKVADRVEIFRKHFGTDFGLDTIIDYTRGFNKGDPVIAIAKITQGEQVIASGHAIEFVGEDHFTYYSPIEVAETSAIGRALAAFGLSGGEYASANEIEAKQAAAGAGGPSNREEDRRSSYGAEGDHRPSSGEETRRVSNGATATTEEPEDKPSSGMFIPGDRDKMWDDLPGLQDVILDGIDRINNHEDLSIYWAELEPAMQRLNVEQPVMHGQIKAAFAAAYSIIQGRA